MGFAFLLQVSASSFDTPRRIPPDEDHPHAKRVPEVLTIGKTDIGSLIGKLSRIFAIRKVS
jgi:hypothetical protein